VIFFEVTCQKKQKTLSKFQNHDFADFSIYGLDYQMTIKLGTFSTLHFHYRCKTIRHIHIHNIILKLLIKIYMLYGLSNCVKDNKIDYCKTVGLQSYMLLLLRFCVFYVFFKIKKRDFLRFLLCFIRFLEQRYTAQLQNQKTTHNIWVFLTCRASFSLKVFREKAAETNEKSHNLYLSAPIGWC